MSSARRSSRLSGARVPVYDEPARSRAVPAARSPVKQPTPPSAGQSPAAKRRRLADMAGGDEGRVEMVGSIAPPSPTPMMGVESEAPVDHADGDRARPTLEPQVAAAVVEQEGDEEDARHDDDDDDDLRGYDEQMVQYESVPMVHMTAGSGVRHITVDAPPLPPEAPYIENPLPGVADEVESYPCRLCLDNRVFLTSFGLERHTRLEHPDNIDDAIGDIQRIQEEWRRRETERERQRERLALAKIRQEALAAAAAREAIHGSMDLADGESAQFVMDTGRVVGEHSFTGAVSGGWGRHPSRQRLVEVAPDDVAVMAEYGDAAMGAFQQRANFESCRICGLLINADHPTAMENHMRAHKKNDELRSHLLNTYGPEFVARVTCHECQLVFTDERKLIAHAEAMHVRRRKYVCKWCGHVCLTMTDLNAHKSDVHGMPVSRSRDPDIRRQRQIAALTKGHGLPPPLGVQSAASRRAAAMAEASRATAGGSSVSSRVLTSVEELPCRTTCDLCGLIMVKPSLLIRHMMRVHSRTNFTATVETKGMPSFKVTVEKGKLKWTCCTETYTDRSAFIYHRRMNHQPKLTAHPGNTASARQVTLSEASAASSQQEQSSADGQYVLMMVGEDGQAQQTPAEAQEIVLTPEQLQQLGIGADDGDNVLVLIDDGSGNLTTADGSQLTADQQLLLLEGENAASASN